MLRRGAAPAAPAQRGCALAAGDEGDQRGAGRARQGQKNRELRLRNLRARIGACSISIKAVRRRARDGDYLYSREYGFPRHSLKTETEDEGSVCGERKRKRKAVSGRVGRRLRRARAGTSRSLRERFSRSARLRDPPAAPDVRFRPDRRGQAPHGVHGDPDKHAHDGGPRPDGVPERYRSRRRAKRTRREARRGGRKGV